ncbi:MAG: hypothetical protein M1536_07360 [Firmicutes bacterium]|nr:hypothetical protein [Bacillota bacterium]
MPGERIGWFTLEASFTEMKKAIGKPENVKNESDGTITVSCKSKYEVVMVISKDTVIDIETDDTRYSLPEKIKVRSSKDEVIKAFGTDYKLTNYEGNGQDVSYLADGIGFGIKDNKIWEFGVFPGY